MSTIRRVRVVPGKLHPRSQTASGSARSTEKRMRSWTSSKMKDRNRRRRQLFFQYTDSLASIRRSSGVGGPTARCVQSSVCESHMFPFRYAKHCISLKQHGAKKNKLLWTEKTNISYGSTACVGVFQPYPSNSVERRTGAPFCGNKR